MVLEDNLTDLGKTKSGPVLQIVVVDGEEGIFQVSTDSRPLCRKREGSGQRDLTQRKGRQHMPYPSMRGMKGNVALWILVFLSGVDVGGV